VTGVWKLDRSDGEIQQEILGGECGDLRLSLATEIRCPDRDTDKTGLLMICLTRTSL